MRSEASLLCETSKNMSFGSGVVARVMLSEYQSPLGSRVRDKGVESAEAKGEKNGKETRALCDRFRVVKFGKAQIFVGR